MSKKFFVLGFLAIIISFTSCTKKATTPKKIRKRDTKSLVVEPIDFQYFSSRTKIRYKEGKRNINGNANIRIKKDSLIWISLSPSVGIEVTRGILTRDSIIVINRLDKVYYKASYADLSHNFNFNLDFHLLQSILLGDMPFEKNEDDLVKKESGYLRIRQNRGELVVDNYVKANTGKVETILLNERSTKNALTLKYSEFEKLEQYLFPLYCMVNLTYNKNNTPLVTSISIEHNRAELEDKPLCFPFNIPSRYERKDF